MSVYSDLDDGGLVVSVDLVLVRAMSRSTLRYERRAFYKTSTVSLICCMFEPVQGDEGEAGSSHVHVQNV